MQLKRNSEARNYARYEEILSVTIGASKLSTTVQYFKLHPPEYEYKNLHANY